MVPPEETVLSKADWERIQSLLNKPPAKVSTREEVVESNMRIFKQRQANENALSQQFKEFRTAQKLRKQAHEDYLNMLAAEEVEMRKQDWQEAVDKANIKRFHQDDLVRKFNRAVLDTHVQQENMKLLEIKQEQWRMAEEYKRQNEEVMRCKQKEALRQEREKAHQRQLNNKLLAENHIENMKDKRRLREEQRQQEKEERCKLQHLDDLHAQELRHQAVKKVESKKIYLKCKLEDISLKKLNREREAQRLIGEEKIKEHELSIIDRWQQQVKTGQAEWSRKLQIPRDIVTSKLAAIKQEQATSRTLREEAKFLREVSENNNKVRTQRMNKEEKRAAMLKSISAHRQIKIQEKERKRKAEKQESKDWLMSQKQLDKLFLEQQKQKAKATKDFCIKYNEANATLMDENRAHLEQVKREEHEAEEKDAEQIAKKDKEYHQYFLSALQKAAESKQNVPCLLNTARKLLPEFAIEEIHSENQSSMTDMDQLKYLGKFLPRLDSNKLRPSQEEISEVSLKPTRFPPISTKDKLKSNDTLASREAATEQCFLSSIVEGSNYLSEDAGKLLPRLGTAHTKSHQVQHCHPNKLHLSPRDLSVKPFCLPPISTKK